MVTNTYEHDIHLLYIYEEEGAHVIYFFIITTNLKKLQLLLALNA